MDETQNTGKDTSQTTADSSKQTTGTTSTETTPTTFSEEQVTKKVNDALAKAGREAKTLTELKTKYETGLADLVTKQKAWQKQQEEAEEVAVADDAPALTALRARRQKKADDEVKSMELAEREAKLAKRETELADIVERDRILNRTQLAAEVAVEKGVSIDAILKLAKEDTREAYETVAELLPKVKETPALLSDSNKIKGSEDISSLSPKEKIERGLAKLTKK